MAAIAQPPPVHTPTLDEPPQSHLTDLLPVNPPLVLLPAYAKTEVTTVWIDSVSYVSGDNFFVKDENNNVLLSSIGKEWSTRNKKTIFNPDNKALFHIKDDIFTTHHTMTATRDGNTLFKVSYYPNFHGSQGQAKFEATFHDPRTTGRVQIDVTGDWMINEVTIRVAPHGTLIGRARRGDTAVAFVKTDDPRVQSDKEERVTTQYKLTVAPNVDIALISAICMCCEAIQSQVKGG